LTHLNIDNIINSIMSNDLPVGRTSREKLAERETRHQREEPTANGGRGRGHVPPKSTVREGGDAVASAPRPHSVREEIERDCEGDREGKDKV
jgi:hypothetical protein